MFRNNPRLEINNLNDNQITVCQVSPQLTDARIDNWLDPHYVAFQNNCDRRPQLFLYLGGSFGKPGQQKMFLKEVINLGFIVINLNYPNSWTIASLCQNHRNLHCHYQRRRAVIYGQNTGGKIIIDHANSLENRLYKLLTFLAGNVPQIPWLDYLDGEQIKWESIMIAGHSQGGGHAALIGIENLVSRLIMFASPADYSQTHEQMASWLFADKITPSDRFYGFIHYHDSAYAKVTQAWKLLGLDNYGELTNIDQTPLSEVYSHQLVTTAQPTTPDKFHGSVVNDAHTPKIEAGKPLYQDVWRYLCTNDL